MHIYLFIFTLFPQQTSQAKHLPQEVKPSWKSSLARHPHLESELSDTGTISFILEIHP